MSSIGTIMFKKGSTWVDILHPVGSFYISQQSTSPASLFGGTWVQVTNAVLRGATSTTGYTGSDTHTLTVNEMPQHRHSLIGWVNGYLPAQTARDDYNWIGNEHSGWRSDAVIEAVGGGHHIPSCSAPTTASSGTGQANRGDAAWQNLLTSNSGPARNSYRSTRSRSAVSSFQPGTRVPHLSTAVRGLLLRTADSCGWQVRGAARAAKRPTRSLPTRYHLTTITTTAKPLGVKETAVRKASTRTGDSPLSAMLGRMPPFLKAEGLRTTTSRPTGIATLGIGQLSFQGVM